MGLSVRRRTRRYALVTSVVMVVAMVTAMAPSASTSPRLVAAAQGAPTAVGRAVAVSLQSVVANATVADTGEVGDPARSPVRRSVTSLPGPVLSGTLAEGSVVIPSTGEVQSQALVTDLHVDLVGDRNRVLPGLALVPLLSISLPEVRAVSRSSCSAGSSGQVRLGVIVINGIEVSTGGLPPPNTRVNLLQLPLVSVVLNEQVPVPATRGGGLTVNAVRITLANVLDLVVSSATSQVTNCPEDRPQRPVLEVDPGLVRAGRVMTVRGRGFAPSAPVRITFDAPDLRPVEGTAEPDGSLRIPVVVPRDARLGHRTLTGSSGDRSATAEFVILRRPAQPPGAQFETGMPGGFP